MCIRDRNLERIEFYEAGKADQIYKWIFRFYVLCRNYCTGAVSYTHLTGMEPGAVFTDIPAVPANPLPPGISAFLRPLQYL